MKKQSSKKGLKQCHKLLNEIKKSIENNDPIKAKKLYIECRKYYVKLSEENQKEIYDKMQVLYEELS